jgi:hypothetical protein
MLKLLENDINSLAKTVIGIRNLHIKNKRKKYGVWIYHLIVQKTLRYASARNCQK